MKVLQIGTLMVALCAAGVSTAVPASSRVPSLRPMPSELQNEASVAVLGYGAIGAGALPLEEFQQQMRYLQSEGIHPVSLQDFLTWRAGLLTLPEKSVLLTFEHVDAAFVRDVFPVLRACRFPFLIFVDVEKLGATPDDLSVRDLQMMVRLGAAVGCTSGDAEMEKRWQAAELKGNAAINTLAENELGAPSRRLRTLCGSCDAYSHSSAKSDVSLLRHLVRQGFAAAFSRMEGKAQADSPGFMLPRYMVDGNTAFARAVNFGSKGHEVSIAATMEDSRPTSEIPDAAMGVEFEDDMVAEEADDEVVAEVSSTPEPEKVEPLAHTTLTPSSSAAGLVPPPVAALTPSALVPTTPVEKPVATPALAGDGKPAPAATQPAVPTPVTVTPAPAVTSEPKSEPATPAEPAPTPAVADSPTLAPADTPAQVTEAPAMEPTYANLARRDGTGDWVTTRFEKPLVPREKTRVAVLGYHNFSNTKPVSEMRMRTYEFCQQMQYIKNAGLSVITMQDFIEWRFGDRCLPERCILITIDDGWKSVFTDAYPVLKAYGYPFTMFLYTRYINVQGDSMTDRQIKEMLEHGATVGSHSSNHLYPSGWKKIAQDSPAYAEQVQRELIDSGTKLKGMFGACSTYCYPGGYHTPPMLEGLKNSDYKLAFTVIESKVDCTEDPLHVHRYMVFGVNPNIFRRAVNFDGEPGIIPTRMGIAAAIKPAREFFPQAFEGVGSKGWSQASVADRVAKRVGKSRKGAKAPAPAAPQPEPTTQPTQEPAPAN